MIDDLYDFLDSWGKIREIIAKELEEYVDKCPYIPLINYLNVYVMDNQWVVKLELEWEDFSTSYESEVFIGFSSTEEEIREKCKGLIAEIDKEIKEGNGVYDVSPLALIEVARILHDKLENPLHSYEGVEITQVGTEYLIKNKEPLILIKAQGRNKTTGFTAQEEMEVDGWFEEDELRFLIHCMLRRLHENCLKEGE